MSRKQFRLVSLLAIFVVYAIYETITVLPPDAVTSVEESSPSETTSVSTSNADIVEAFENQRSDVQVAGTGNVVRLLPDDNKGSRHQKFILELDSGLTLLVSHNIDLAPRVDNLSIGDQIDFFGEYEWNDRGGVIHWTHHDPAKRHPDGWLKHNGNVYQ